MYVKFNTDEKIKLIEFDAHELDQLGFHSPINACITLKNQLPPTPLHKAYEYFDNARMRWNDKHDIKVKGYDVEIYVEDSRESHKSSGVYSIIKDEWNKEPKKFQSSIDFGAARRKADDIEFQVNIIDNLVIAGKYRSALRNTDRLKAKIRNMRRAGLESPKQEFSVENITFKILRRNGILDLLDSLKTQAYDSMLNIREE